MRSVVERAVASIGSRPRQSRTADCWASLDALTNCSTRFSEMKPAYTSRFFVLLVVRTRSVFFSAIALIFGRHDEPHDKCR
jgi:hypothetical protein